MDKMKDLNRDVKDMYQFLSTTDNIVIFKAPT